MAPSRSFLQGTETGEMEGLASCTNNNNNKQADSDQLSSAYQCSNISKKRKYYDKCLSIPCEDLLVEIFKRMPVKGVCRMRCVCKPWNDLISSSFFVAHHHQNSSSIPTSYKSYTVYRIFSVDHKYSYTLYMAGWSTKYTFCQGVPSLRLHTAPNSPLYRPLPFRSRKRHNHLTFLNAIHGVVCLTTPSNNPTNSRAILWNPTIRKYVVIPSSQLGVSERNSFYAPSLGFGFDSLSHEFHLIRLWMPFQHPEPGDEGHHASLVYEMLSTREGVWKKAVGGKIRPCKVVSRNSFFMNKRIHWMVCSSPKARNPHRSQYRVLTFDCERKKFATMELPLGFDQMEEVLSIRLVHIFKCRGMLSVFALISREEFSFWVMKEYGNVRTWMKVPDSECQDEFFNLVMEESMLLMDANKMQAVSYVEKRDRADGKVYYEIDGRAYISEHILI